VSVYEDSRYSSCEFTTVVGKDKIARKYLHPRTPKTLEEVDPDWVSHDAKYGDDLDLLAYQYSGDNANRSKYWWMIADVNDILWPLDIEPGTKLVIPTRMLAIKGMKS
jgi:nucleoid-associated protein YgaU